MHLTSWALHTSMCRILSINVHKKNDIKVRYNEIMSQAHYILSRTKCEGLIKKFRVKKRKKSVEMVAKDTRYCMELYVMFITYFDVSVLYIRLISLIGEPH